MIHLVNVINPQVISCPELTPRETAASPLSLQVNVIRNVRTFTCLYGPSSVELYFKNFIERKNDDKRVCTE